MSYTHSVLEDEISNLQADLENDLETIQRIQLNLDQQRGHANWIEARIAEIRRALKLIK